MLPGEVLGRPARDQAAPTSARRWMQGEMRNAAKRRDWEAGYELFDGICDPSANDYMVMLHVADRCDRAVEAEEFLKAMKMRGLPVHMNAYNSLVNLHARSGNIERIHELLQEMQEKSIQKDLIMYSTVLNGYAKCRDITGAIATWEEMVATGIRPSNVAYISFLNVFAEAAEPQLALERLEEMTPRHDLAPRCPHFNVVLKACKYKSDGAAALAVLRMMNKASVKPDTASYTAALGAIMSESAEGWRQEADALLATMDASGVLLDMWLLDNRLAAHLGLRVNTVELGTFAGIDARYIAAAASDICKAKSDGLQLSSWAHRVHEMILVAQRAGSAPAGLESATDTGVPKNASSPTQGIGASLAESGAWVEVRSAAHGTYFWNRDTGVTQWEHPDGIPGRAGSLPNVEVT